MWAMVHHGRRAVLVLAVAADLARSSEFLNITRRTCFGCSGENDPGRDAVCWTGQLRSQHFAGQDKTPGGSEAHFVRNWAVLREQFPSADHLFVINSGQCDLLLRTLGRMQGQGPGLRMLVWCYDDQALHPKEAHFLRNSPRMAWKKQNILGQYRKIAACADMAQALAGPGTSYARITKLRYDSRICALDAARLPTDGVAAQLSGLWGCVGEYSLVDFLISAPEPVMQVYFGLYHWILDESNWKWISDLFAMRPQRATLPSLSLAPPGPFVEDLVLYYLFTHQQPLVAVPPSVLKVVLGRLGEAACVSWPKLDPGGWPVFGGSLTRCIECFRFDGLLTAALAEFFRRGRKRLPPKVLDLGAGQGLYTKALLYVRVLAVAVDRIHPDNLYNEHPVFSWRADVTRLPLGRLSATSAFFRSALFRSTASFPVVSRNQLSWQSDVTHNTSGALNASFDWALVLRVDTLEPSALAASLLRTVRGVVVTGSEDWLDSLGIALGQAGANWVRDERAESQLRLFAGTTSCCMAHRTLRVYSSESLPASSVADAGVLEEALDRTAYPGVHGLDTWRTYPTATPPAARALWLQAVRATQLPQTGEEKAALLRWLCEVDWAELFASDLSVFDVPIEGTASQECELACKSTPTLGPIVARQMQAQARQQGGMCILGCFRSVQHSRAEVRLEVLFLEGGVKRYRQDASGLYAYKVIGAMHGEDAPYSETK
ncbi:unnamed protein product [Polarella glacialis]|uniref:Uncharacterized protein n=1 Tax=Polarella glacialis TaxID=89957 RepID=A0A813L7Q1_POLGL|nr:unnamed protein product [Polarella glacialis]